MSYSRWGESRWYTFWACQEEETENRDTSLFEICTVASFAASELRADIDACLAKAVAAEQVRGMVADDEIEELRGYMLEFLDAVDNAYP